MRWAVAVLALAAGGCGHTDVTTPLPWVQYRRITGPGGSGMWAGSRHTEVRVRRWWGWSTAFDADAAPGAPIVVTPSVVLVLSQGAPWILRESDTRPVRACGDKDDVAEVPPDGGFVDCVGFLSGPARGVATGLRLRRLDPTGTLVAQQDFTTGDQGRVFLTPTIEFYDDEKNPYLVTFRDPWTGDDGTRGTASPERLAAITCELVRVGLPAQVTPAPPGHAVAECSEAGVWSRALGRPLRRPSARP